MNKPELLAPAGSLEALYAAVDNGADAVYFGIGQLNARANAENLTMDTLPEAISYAHLRSVRLYLTLNTILHDNELDEAVALAKEAYDLGVDAIIIQDRGLAYQLKLTYPEIPLHASTQMNLFDSRQLAWASEHGFSRVILPRELSVDEMIHHTQVARENHIETEVFIHGALCVCYSGLCLFSAMNGNGARSGNRGLCAQPCRTLFSLVHSSGKEDAPERILSPKDQCALSYLKLLMDAGVRSLKIEGRMKDAAYVAVTVRSYREYIDLICEQKDDEKTETAILNHLLLAFNRGGSFLSEHVRGGQSDLLAGEYSGRYGLYAGVVVKRNAAEGTLSFRLSAAELPTRGDYLSIRVREKEIASFPIGTIDSYGDVIRVKGLHPQLIGKIPDGASVYQMSETAYTKMLLTSKDSHKSSIRMRLSATKDNATICLSLVVDSGMWKGVSIDYCENAIQTEFAKVLDHQRISEQLSKVKSTPFHVLSVEIDPELSIAVPISHINEMRRNAIGLLESKINEEKHADHLSKPRSAPVKLQSENSRDLPKTHSYVHANYYDLRRISPSTLAVGADIYSFSVYDVLSDYGQTEIEKLHDAEPDALIQLRLPGAYSDAMGEEIVSAISYLKEQYAGVFSGVCSTSTYDEEMTSITASANIYNAFALLDAVLENPFSVELSYELKEHEYLAILSHITPQEMGSTFLSIHLYGRIEWMQTAFCPVGKQINGCHKCEQNASTFCLSPMPEDNTKSPVRKMLPVITHPGPCCSEILGGMYPSVASSAVITATQEKGIHVIFVARFYDETYENRKSIIRDIHITKE